MPVRRIVPSHSSLTGRLVGWKASEPIQFESSLERDLAFLLEFDQHVLEYDVQPLTIKYEDEFGRKRRYTPDFLVKYSPYSSVVSKMKPTLYEVKYRDDLKKNWNELKPKFKAGISYARDKNMIFKIITEKEIRTERLWNARFLFSYKERSYGEGRENIIMNELTRLGESNPENLINSISSNIIEKAENIYVLWHLVANYRIQVDLDEQLNMRSVIWIR